MLKSKKECLGCFHGQMLTMNEIRSENELNNQNI